jgi:hypothetical protein
MRTDADGEAGRTAADFARRPRARRLGALARTEFLELSG